MLKLKLIHLGAEGVAKKMAEAIGEYRLFYE